MTILTLTEFSQSLNFYSRSDYRSNSDVQSTAWFQKTSNTYIHSFMALFFNLFHIQPVGSLWPLKGKDMYTDWIRLSHLPPLFSAVEFCFLSSVMYRTHKNLIVCNIMFSIMAPWCGVHQNGVWNMNKPLLTENLTFYENKVDERMCVTLCKLWARRTNILGIRETDDTDGEVGKSLILPHIKWIIIHYIHNVIKIQTNLNLNHL